MRIPLNWIKEYTTLTNEPSALAERISVSLAEVEKIESIEGELVLEIENKALTHRSDCFSIEGFSREVAAITGSPYTQLPENPIPEKTADKPLTVEVVNTDLCPRYTAIVIDQIKIKPSPELIQKRLRLCGIRPINNVVDITNYIMLKTGQPLHAFDYERLSNDKKIIVRTAQNNEILMSLDGVSRKLDTNMLVIADSEKPIAIAGIMGGENSEVTENTTTIVLESANFEHFNNRYTSLHLGLRTEASLRFEKGQDPNATNRALREAVLLYIELAEGKIASEIVDAYPVKTDPTTVEFRPSSISRRLGAELSEDNVASIIRSLHIECVKKDDLYWEAVIPTFRRDIHLEADLLEEVARIYGYDRIVPSLPSRTLEPAPSNPEVAAIRKIKSTLVKLGLNEIYTYTFTNSRLYENLDMLPTNPIRIKNPMSPDLELIRPSLLPSMLEKVALNATRFTEFSLFEINKVFEKSSSGLPIERKSLCMGVYSVTDDTYPKAKGILETLLLEQGIRHYRFVPVETMAPFSENEISKITIENNPIGLIGNISARAKKCLTIGGNATLISLDISPLLNYSPSGKEYQPLPKYPETLFDLSFIIPQSVLIGDLLAKIKEGGYLYLKEVEVFDIFTNQKLGTGNKSIALHLLFSSAEKTLSTEEVRAEVHKIETILESAYQAVIRKEE